MKRLKPKKEKKTLEFKGCVKYNEAKTDYYTVYLIPNYDGNDNAYVGVTSNLTYRIYKHACGEVSTNTPPKQNTYKTVVLHKIYDRKDAFAMERRYHAIGFDGGKETLKVAS